MPLQQRTSDSGILSVFLFTGLLQGHFGAELEMPHCSEGIIKGFEQFSKTG